jgi:DHA2 family multidrug resistance protein
VPLALLVAPVAWRMLKRYEEALVRAPIDKIGLALLIVFVAALQLMLDLGKEHDWFASNEICLLAIVAAVGFLAFLIWESAERHPIVNLRVFRHRGFAASVVTISLGFGAMFGANALTPLWLQSYMGYTATWAGLATAWTGALAVVGAPLAGALLARTDPRRLVFCGLVWLGGIMLVRTVATTDMTYWQIARPLIFMGLGLPFFFVPVTQLALGSVAEHETASAAGLMNFIRTLSGAVATSIVTTAWEDKTTYMHAELAGLVDQSGETTRTLANMGLSSDAVRSALDNMAQSQSVMLATNELLLLVAVAFTIAAAVIWLAPRPTRKVDMTQAGH